MPCRPTKFPSGRARFVLPGPNPGLLDPGNIDLFHRPFAPNKGAISTVDSASWDLDDGTTILVSTVKPLTAAVRGSVISPRAALALARREHRHLGIFENFHYADRYSARLHLQQARIYCLR